MKEKENKIFGNGGFTLIEVMIIMVILGILSFMAYPSMMATIRINKIRAAAADIAGNIKLTRSYAIKEASNRYIITFNPGVNQYTLGFDNVPSPGGDLVPEGFGQGGPRIIDLTAYSSDIQFGSDANIGPSDSLVNNIDPATVSGINYAGAPKNIRFNPDGTVRTTGGVFIKDGAGNNYCIGVDTVVGTVILWRWQGGTNWKKIY